MDNLRPALKKDIIDLFLRMDRLSLFYVFNLGHQFHITRKAQLVSRLGDGYFYALLAALIYLLDDIQGSEFVKNGLLAFAIELPLYLILKNTIRRPRPTRKLVRFRHKASDKFSLPSGHTAAAFLIATLLSFHYPMLYPLFFAIAGMIGGSRVLLGVHYPSDIAAGILLGSSCALLVISS